MLRDAQRMQSGIFMILGVVQSIFMCNFRHGALATSDVSLVSR